MVAACEDEDDTPTPGRRPANGQSTEASEHDPGRAENVIVIVGDGMGIAHREPIRLTTLGRDGELAMNQLQHQGWTHTDRADPERAVTDSAAAATALATGVRAYNGAIAVDVDGDPVTTLLEEAERAGKATGVVTTARVTDATPAAFAAHADERGDQGAIARQYLEETEVEVILGGGEDRWTRRCLSTTTASRRSMGRPCRCGRWRPRPWRCSRRTRTGSSSSSRRRASHTMAHRGNAELMIAARRALDETVALARDFVAEHGSTFLVVVGDHETGGLTIDPADDGTPEQPGNGPFPVDGTDLLLEAEWATGGHTAAATPASAEGPGAHGMVGVRDSTNIHGLALDAMQLDRGTSTTNWASRPDRVHRLAVRFPTSQ